MQDAAPEHAAPEHAAPHAAPHAVPHAAPHAAPAEPKRRGRPLGSKNKPKQDVPTEPAAPKGDRQRGGGGGGHGGFGTGAEARIPRRRGRQRHAGHPGRGAAGAHAHHVRQLPGALQQPELRGRGQLHGGRLPAGGLRHDPERLRLQHRAHLHADAGETLLRYSFGCRHRLGTASNLAMYVSAADNDYVGVTGTFLGTASQGVWSTARRWVESQSCTSEPLEAPSPGWRSSRRAR